MLNNVSSTIFSEAESVELVPSVSAEWNQNLFNPAYMTVAGDGVKMSLSLTSGTVSDVISDAKPNFITKSFSMSSGSGAVAYTVTTNNKKSYKIVTFVKTDNATPVMITCYGQGETNQYGSSQEEVDSLGWTKIITYVATAPTGNNISSFIFTIKANAISGTNINPVVYFTVPEIYETTYFDYQNHSLWPTDSVFTFFRPGESYVPTGNINCSFPTNHRKITSSIINGYTSPIYQPVSPIINTPGFFLAAPPVPNIKNVLQTDISPYKYFVSDFISRSITGIYEKPIVTNKLVFKFNTLMTIPLVNIKIDDVTITVDGSQTISPVANSESYNTGVLVLYWNGSAWTKTRWSDMPSFNSSGGLTKYTSLSKITVTQIDKTKRTEFSSYTNVNITNDLDRMQLVEISPRLEVDVTDFVESFSLDKSFDSRNSLLPISSVNTNSCQITLSGIPPISGTTLVPLFSSESNDPYTMLTGLLRKNIKFYTNFKLSSYTILSMGTTNSTSYIPAGIFYSDSWDETDINNIPIQGYDISRYLQFTPTPDYVANLKSVFEIITNILDLAGFTDYDYDSLYSICNNKTNPMDLSYFYANSKDSTVIDILNQIFVAYQIGAYIDEYGVMRFLSLNNILSNTESSLYVADANIIENGYFISNKQRPGTISLRYQTPKIKQSPSLQNVNNPSIKNSPSFVYTTSNDVVWQQQTVDSVGFNYLNSNLDQDSNSFNINVADLLDIFHTYNRDANGYAFIDNEIVSFLYKEYIIRNSENTKSITVSIKNDLELQAEINKFIKEYSIGLRTSYATISNVVGDGSVITYTANNSFRVGDKVSITGVNPRSYCMSGAIISANATSFSVLGSEISTYISGGEATIFADYDVVIEPTGNITNVQRGLFGTVPRHHNRINSLSSKNLETNYPDTISIINSQDISSSLPDVDKIRVDISEIGGASPIVFITPKHDLDLEYQTYSAKFELVDNESSSAGIFFNDSGTDDAYYVKLSKCIQSVNNKNVIKYYLTVEGPYDNNGQTSWQTLYWSDVTGECQNIINNTPKVIKKQYDIDQKQYVYTYVQDQYFNLKVVRYITDGSDGENASALENKNVLSIYLNNIEILGWNKPQTPTDPENSMSGWKALDINQLTGMQQKPTIPALICEGKKFGFVADRLIAIENGDSTLDLGDPVPYGTHIANLREIHATQKSLKERSVSYYFQDREFLNGLVQNQPLYLNYATYLMQTTPEVVGINYYDVQYTTPAAVSVDVLPVEYMWYYFPGTSPEDQKKYQKKLVDEYSLSYSTIINTGFRAKMAIANNTSHMVFLHKESDDLDQFTINLNLWTHEIIAPSDPAILEVVIDQSNINETAQLDSEWLQSKYAAQKTLKLIEKGVDKFSKDITLEIFGNPLIQIGDIITLTYANKGISQQKHFVHSVSHNFDNGLNTRLGLVRLT